MSTAYNPQRSNIFKPIKQFHLKNKALKSFEISVESPPRSQGSGQEEARGEEVQEHEGEAGDDGDAQAGQQDDIR